VLVKENWTTTAFISRSRLRYGSVAASVDRVLITVGY